MGMNLTLPPQRKGPVLSLAFYGSKWGGGLFFANSRLGLRGALGGGGGKKKTGRTEEARPAQVILICSTSSFSPLSVRAVLTESSAQSCCWSRRPFLFLFLVKSARTAAATLPTSIL